MLRGLLTSASGTWGDFPALAQEAIRNKPLHYTSGRLPATLDEDAKRVIDDIHEIIPSA
jgi:hypothetical protein